MTIKKLFHNIFSASINHYPAAVFFLLSSGVLLWQMLLPGYVLTLDMVFTPTIKVLFGPDAALNSLPVQIILGWLTAIVPGWVIQKLVLVALFFCMGFFGYLFLPVPNTLLARYWAGIFMMVNPFVYERFLAGQWQILWAYALIPLYLYLVLRLSHKPTATQSILIAATAVIIAAFSVHIFVMCLVFSTGLFFVGVLMLWRNRLALLRFIRATFLSVMLVIGGVSYWLIPFVIKNAQGSVFDIANARSFSVAALSGHGILTTLATGYGFWGAAQPWASSFIWPYHYPFIFWPLFFILFAIVIYGAYHAFHGRPLIASFFCSLWVIAIVFSGGLIGPFGGVNQWLYETIPFWSGFRDSQKWSALIMISYAFFGAWGTSELFQVLRRYRPSLAPMAKLLLLIPVLYTFTLPGGFSRQLQPVWYPASWHQANEILASRIQTGEQRVLYLPWHQYYSLPFNHNLLTINPARAFFDVQIVQSENPEVGVLDREPDELHTKIDLLITNSTEYTDSEIAQLLSNYGISYVMVGDSVDPLLDVFLLKLANISLFRPIFVGEGLTLYEILI